VKNNPARRRYEIHVDGEVAGFAAYRSRDDAVVFTHTEIDEAHEGQGLGSALARGALDDVRESGGSVVPLCPFIKGYIDRHPEYGDLVTA
jgi:predicted GNAT family acetyltransferase